MARKKGSRDYPQELKRKAIELYLEESWSYAAIAEALGINDLYRVGVWVRGYQQEGEAYFLRRRGRPPRKKPDKEAYIKQLEMENDLLKKFHAELRQSWPKRSNTE